MADLLPFFKDESWLRGYGTPLVLLRSSTASDGIELQTRLVLYEDGTKIDYILWSVDHLEKVLGLPRLPDNLDVGYRVLVDKDGLTEGLKPRHTPPIYRRSRRRRSSWPW